MNLAPLLDAPLAIQIHVASVVPAALIGPFLFWGPKGTPTHRLVGKVWIGLMVMSALSSFFIHEIDVLMGFSPIHLISIYVLFGAWLAVQHARSHRMVAHKRQVAGLYLGGIVGAGAFTLLPGRIMHAVVFAFPAHWPETGRVMLFLGMMAAIIVLLTLAARVSTSGRA
jgi:uncharacterized membrane protein